MPHSQKAPASPTPDVATTPDASAAGCPRVAFTPGPWAVVFDSMSFYASGSEFLTTTIEGPDEAANVTLAAIVTDLGDESVANAHLIAAAPHLFEVVRHGLDCCAFLPGTHLRQAAEAAYLKACGQLAAQGQSSTTDNQTEDAK